MVYRTAQGIVRVSPEAHPPQRTERSAALKSPAPGADWKDASGDAPKTSKCYS